MSLWSNLPSRFLGKTSTAFLLSAKISITHRYSFKMSFHTCIIGDPSMFTSVSDINSSLEKFSSTGGANKEPTAAPSKILLEDPTHIKTELFVNITSDLHERLSSADSAKDYEVHSDTSDESLFIFGSIPGNVGDCIDKLDYLGSISSDSHLVSIIPLIGLKIKKKEGTRVQSIHEVGQNATKEKNNDPVDSEFACCPESEQDLDVDWEDFMMTVLNDPSLQVDREGFPLYLFFGRIPEEDCIVSIYGLQNGGDEQKNTNNNLGLKGKVYSSLVLRSRECVLDSLTSHK